ncbi:MAG: hypothetical protein HY238_00585 [Acidobacteria bacterium]|nr:hypothetical protein [Acidobacteriota bacterium]
MPAQVSRRRLLQSIGAATGSRLVLRAAATLEGELKLTLRALDLSDASLAFIRQMGVEWVTMVGPGAPTWSPAGRVIPRSSDVGRSPGPWTEAEIRRIKDRIESAGLRRGWVVWRLANTELWRAGPRGRNRQKYRR